MRKRQRVDVHTANEVGGNPPGPPSAGPPVGDDAFIADQDANDSGGDDDDDDEGKPKSDKKAGRRKIKIEFIQDKSRRHITFSKRKAGIMKKAYELSTLTGTQVLLLVVSETGLVYTFTTAKLQPLVTQPEGKNLIQACLNAPHGSLPSSMPVGTPIGRSSGPLNMSGPAPNTNMPGGLSIGQNSGPVHKEAEDEGEENDRRPSGDQQRRTSSSNIGSRQGPTSPQSANATVPPPLSIPPPSAGPQSAAPQQSAGPNSAHPGLAHGQPTSPPQQHSQVPLTPSQSQYPYGHGPPTPHQAHHPPPGQGDNNMYQQGHMMGSSYTYGSNQTPQQPLGGLAAAAAAHHQQQWGPQPPAQAVQGGPHYGRR